MMLKSVELEIKKEHQVLIVNKTTSFKKKGEGKERELQEEVLLLQREWSLEAELPQMLGG